MPVLPSYRNQSIDLLCKSIDWFLYEGNTGINMTLIRGISGEACNNFSLGNRLKMSKINRGFIVFMVIQKYFSRVAI